MKLPSIAVILIAIALGFALGRVTVQSGGKVGAVTTATGKHGSADELAGESTAAERSHEATNTPSKTRVRQRRDDGKKSEPKVSVPLKTVVDLLREHDLNYAKFDSLDYQMSKALPLLGATAEETVAVREAIQTSMAEILAAEKNHVKLGAVTEDRIGIDMSDMTGPAERIVSRLKDGIRDALPSDLADGLISAINWERYYPTAEAATFLEITRSGSGKLTAWERSGNGGTGESVDAEFPGDGTPLPADRIFADRWKPFLKGVTILPRDDHD